MKEDETLLFGDFMVPGQNKEDRIYEEIKVGFVSLFCSVFF